MASGNARWHIQTITMTTMKLCNMAALLQLIGWARHAALVSSTQHTFLTLDIPCYGQLTPFKTRYPLTSITWPCHRLMFRAHEQRSHVLFLKWSDVLEALNYHTWLVENLPCRHSTENIFSSNYLAAIIMRFCCPQSHILVFNYILIRSSTFWGLARSIYWYFISLTVKSEITVGTYSLNIQCTLCMYINYVGFISKVIPKFCIAHS